MKHRPGKFRKHRKVSMDWSVWARLPFKAWYLGRRYKG